MTDLFQLPTGGQPVGGDNPFGRYGLTENPFPSAGLESGVFYPDHMQDELARVNQWINEVADATVPTRQPAGPLRPLAVYGSLGVGKTHLLRTLERGLSANDTTPVLRKGLADEGMTRLVLANLFLRYLPFQDADQEPGTGLLRRLVQVAKEDAARREVMLASLRGGGPVRTPFQALVGDRLGDEAIVWMSRWLRREYTTPAQRAKLGLAGVLQSEGEAVRAVADLLRLARAAGLLRAWFVMIDQMEELWRPGVITSSRRARFLTDLRHLVDHALEGSPIALLLAWNTTVDEELFSADVADHMQQDYRALWQRLGEPVNLPLLGPGHVWPFARKYLEAAGVTKGVEGPKAELYRALERSTKDVIEELQGEGMFENAFAPRRVLRAWRKKAFEIAQGHPR